MKLQNFPEITEVDKARLIPMFKRAERETVERGLNNWHCTLEDKEAKENYLISVNKLKEKLKSNILF